MTGGPGGGKTTAVDLFRREIGEGVVIVPEAAGGVDGTLADLLLRTNQLERARFYAARVNASAANAQSLWLAARIEQRLGNRPGTAEWGQRLLREYPQAAEAQLYRDGRFE